MSLYFDFFKQYRVFLCQEFRFLCPPLNVLRSKIGYVSKSKTWKQKIQKRCKFRRVIVSCTFVAPYCGTSGPYDDGDANSQAGDVIVDANGDGDADGRGADYMASSWSRRWQWRVPSCLECSGWPWPVLLCWGQDTTCKSTENNSVPIPICNVNWRSLLWFAGK